MGNRYSFDNFIVGKCNRMVYKSCLSVSEKPGRGEMNPLFIYGETGSGKTHIVKALGEYAKEKNPDILINYYQIDEFTCELVEAIRKEKTVEFKKKIRQSDILIIEDIQYIKGKEVTSDVFIKTLEYLRFMEKQVVLTSDRKPQKLNSGNAKFDSIMKWGLVIELKQLDPITKYEILKTYAKRNKVESFLSDELYKYMVDILPNNPRILMGAINKLTNRITVCADKGEGELTYRMAIKELDYLSSELEIITPQIIQSIVSDYYNISIDRIISESREKRISQVRNISMYLSRIYTSRGLNYIGDVHGGRSSSSVLSAVRRISTIKDVDSFISNDINYLSRVIEKMGGKKRND